MPPSDHSTLLFLTDSHIGGGGGDGGGDGSGFQQQPRCPHLTRPVFRAVARAAAARGVDLLVHGGDLTDAGTAREIDEARRLLRLSGVPTAMCLGNHDLMERTSFAAWAAGDDVVWLPHADVLLVNVGWAVGGERGPFWDAAAGCVECLSDAQHEWLDRELARSKDKPAIVVVHAPLDALPPDLTGAAGPLHAPQRAYAESLNAVLDCHPRVKLVLSGHNHVTCATRHGGRAHLSTSSIVEPPFEFRLVRVGDRSLSIETLPAMAMAMDPLPEQVRYLPEKSWVNGRPSDRTLQLEW